MSTTTHIHHSPAHIDAIRDAATPYSDTDIARMALTRLIEPGDVEAGQFIRTHGPVASLRMFIDGVALAPAHLIELTQTGHTPERVAALLDQTAKSGYTFLTPEHENWPVRLAALGDTEPLALWCDGNSAVLSNPAITAIDGARAATSYGEHVAMQLATDLVAAGHTIVTGAAYGITGMATRAALAYGGATIAVQANGVDRHYPAAHQDLIARVAATGGAVVSEVPLGTVPTKWRFQMCARIIAALADQTVIVEAGTRSGSLNTAAHAAAIGRPVFAVPGPVTSAQSAGCHDLIRTGRARLIIRAADLPAPVIADTETE